MSKRLWGGVLLTLFLITGFMLMRITAGDKLAETAPSVETGSLEKTSPPQPTSPPVAARPSGVDFSLSISSPAYELCCGLLPSKVKVKATATIKNTGVEKAHAVKIRFELFSRSNRSIKINGAAYLERGLGDLAGGESKTETVEFTIALSDGMDIQKNGATSFYTIYSVEKNMQLAEEFTV